MSRAISYCDRCGKLVPPSEIDGGSAAVRGDVAICTECMKSMTAEQRAVLLPEPVARSTPRPSSARPGKRHSGARHVTSRTGRSAPITGNSQQKLVLLGVIGGGGVGLVVALIVIFGSSPPPTEDRAAAPQLAVAHTPVTGPLSPAAVPAPPVNVTTPLPTPVIPPVVVSTPVVPVPADPPANAAARLLAEAKALIDDRLSRYDEARSILSRIVDEHPDAPEAAEASTFIADIDRRYGESIDTELQGAVKSALDVAEKGRYGVARSILRSLKPRYGDTAWYRTRGEAAIAEAMAQIDRIKAKHLTSYRKIPIDASDGAWSFHNGQEFKATPGTIKPGSATEPMRMEFAFDGGSYVSAGKDLVPPFGARSLTVKIRGKGCHLGYRIVDSTGQCHQYKEHKRITEEWQELKLELSDSPESWGGANDRKMHPPIKAVIFCAGRREDGPGYLEIKDLVLEPLELAP